ncbi:hypothetical protein PIIN_00065 [Serendipita indica DSM 11827]|uniref:Uncharacterized protein n=1 Tax=Serendipita indica (strain DSM 11827) TaxID=1109443 RepID=G4T530_SERID|nr:hypothetical protein PIIN_00065 [Serendipita indica DSM 11827]
MLLLRRSSNYARHIGARSLRNARHGNRYILLAFFSCLTLLLRALTGAGYQEQIPIAQNQSILRKIRIRSREGIEMGWNALEDPVWASGTRLSMKSSRESNLSKATGCIPLSTRGSIAQKSLESFTSRNMQTSKWSNNI